MKDKKTATKSFLIFLAVFILLIIGSCFVFWKSRYERRIYPNQKIGEINFSGKTKQEAIEIINEKIKTIEDSGFTFENNGKTANLNANTSSIDSGLNYYSFYILPEESAKALFDKSENTNFFLFIKHLFSLKNKIKPVFILEKQPITSFLQESFSELIVEAENAYFYFSNSNKNSGELLSSAEKIGKDINYDKVFKEMENFLANLNSGIINIKTESVYPNLTKEQLELLRNEAENLIEKGNSLTLEVTAEKEFLNWKINSKDVVSWISISVINGNKKLSLDETKLISYLEKDVSVDIDKEIMLPKFEIEEGRVNAWQGGQDGRKLDLEASAKKINEAFLSGTSSVSLVVNSVLVESFSSENELKIKEIIGTGHSNFKGSSASRRHNIKTGANFLHGLLIKPGEEFSLINNLGNIDETGGYKTELVIKGDKTIPEFGGGLCQVGTTMFRTAIKSGLPITMRRNHSYRVSYYEPAGTDATIYDPWPDFRFINDTGNYILIQSRMAGDDLYFDFWGVNDGREVTITDPVIYNMVKPAATKIIESDSLAPGQKKCTESSHNGADAYFDYKVVYPEGATTTPIVETRFKSHYVPWQAVCLIGKSATSTTPIIATSTPQIEAPVPPVISSSSAQ